MCTVTASEIFGFTHGESHCHGSTVLLAAVSEVAFLALY